MNFSSPKFNQEQLYKQRKQFINNAYNQIAYIQKDCKPFLYKLRHEKYNPFHINQLMKFCSNVQLQTVPFLEHDYYLDIHHSPTGKYTLFPAGEFQVYDKPTKQQLFNPLQEIEQDLIIVCNKYYIIETPLYRSVEQILKTLPLANYSVQ